MITSLVNQILTRMSEHLTETMINDVPVDDITLIDKIKIGPFKERIKDYPRRLWIQSGDPEDPDYLDTIASYGRNDSNSKIAYFVPPREIGGGEAWYRRGIVGVELYHVYVTPKPDEETSREMAYATQSKLINAIKTMPLKNLQDDYEVAALIFVYGTSLFEGGGPDDKFLWRGKVRWEILTEMSI